MHQRPYADTGKTVSEIGFGAWQLGNAHDWGAMTDDEGIQLVHAALDRGCNFFDTAPGYGHGASEELLGKALQGRRDDVVINTKFGHRANGTTDFSAAAIRPSIEESLRRLRTDYIDSLILHNPPFEYLNGNSPQYEVLEQLKTQGKIRAYGASVDSSRQMFELMQTTDSRVLEVMFNVFHQETAKAFSMAAEKQVAIIVKVPLDSGWLSGKYNADSHFTGIRNRWSSEVIKRRAQLVEKIRFVTDAHTSLTQAALRFILSHPEVTTIIPGTKSIQQLDENISVADTSMPANHVVALQRIYQEDIAGSGLPW